MATIITKTLLSGSANGRQIKVGATTTPGTLLHTVTNTPGQMDEVWLWAMNSDTTNRKLTIELGGTTTPDDVIEVTIPPESGLVLVVPGLVLNGGVILRAFSVNSNVVLISGFVNRIAV